MPAPLPITITPYTSERSGIVLGWFHVRRGEELVAIAKGEERARRIVQSENEAQQERPSTEAPRT